LNSVSPDLEEPPRPLTPEAFNAERWVLEHEAAMKNSEDWSKRLLTSLAVANAAGLVAIASALPDTGLPIAWQMKTAQAFGAGLIFSGLAMVCRERWWTAKAYRYAWLAREPERFPADVKAMVTWMSRPWWSKLFRPRSAANGVNPNHPALLVHWRSGKWDALSNLTTILATAAFVLALVNALWLQAS